MCGEFLGDVRVAGRAFEDEVLQQMSHSFLAVTFVAGPDFVGDVHCDDRPGRVREEQDAQPVGQAVFGDALDGGDPDHASRQAQRSLSGNGVRVNAEQEARSGHCEQPIGTKEGFHSTR